MNIVEFENVSFTFGGKPKILQDITFSLEVGSLTFVTGAIGSGKTALLKLMSAASTPWAGEIRILGQELLATDKHQLADMRAQIGVMVNDVNLEALARGETVFDPAVRDQQLEQANGLAERWHGRAGGRIQAVMAATEVKVSLIP